MHTGAGIPLYLALTGTSTGTPEVVLDSDEDLFSLFVARSTAMGWMPRPPEQSRGLWEMNDAGVRHNAGPTMTAWFQVAPLVEGSAPVQPFVECSWQTVQRLIPMDVDRARLVLPVAPWAGDADRLTAFFTSAASLSWHHTAAGSASTVVEVDIQWAARPQEDEAIASALAQAMRSRQTGNFELASTTSVHSVRTADDHIPIFVEGERSGVTWLVRAPEWSPGTVAWLGQLAHDLSRDCGLSGAMLVSLSST